MEEERLDGWNGGKTSTSLTITPQLEKLSARRVRNSRRSFGKNDLNLGVFDHGASEEGHDRHPDDIPSLLGVLAESEGIDPAPQHQVPGAKFEKAVPRKATLRLGGDYSEVGGGDVADGVVAVSRVDASRELQGKLGEDMGSGAVLVCRAWCSRRENCPLRLRPQRRV